MFQTVIAELATAEWTKKGKGCFIRHVLEIIATQMLAMIIMQSRTEENSLKHSATVLPRCLKLCMPKKNFEGKVEKEPLNDFATPPSPLHKEQREK